MPDNRSTDLESAAYLASEQYGDTPSQDELREDGPDTLIAEHWHIIRGGIEFEDAAGRFIHVMLGADLFASLTECMSEQGRRDA